VNLTACYPDPTETTTPSLRCHTTRWASSRTYFNWWRLNCATPDDEEDGEASGHHQAQRGDVEFARTISVMAWVIPAPSKTKLDAHPVGTRPPDRGRHDQRLALTGKAGPRPTKASLFERTCWRIAHRLLVSTIAAHGVPHRRRHDRASPKVPRSRAEPGDLQEVRRDGAARDDPKAGRLAASADAVWQLVVPPTLRRHARGLSPTAGGLRTRVAELDVAVTTLRVALRGGGAGLLRQTAHLRCGTVGGGRTVERCRGRIAARCTVLACERARSAALTAALTGAVAPAHAARLARQGTEQLIAAGEHRTAAVRPINSAGPTVLRDAAAARRGNAAIGTARRRSIADEATVHTSVAHDHVARCTITPTAAASRHTASLVTPGSNSARLAGLVDASGLPPKEQA
jgi:hypothetical protein